MARTLPPLSIDPCSGEPIWRQIVEQLKVQIASRELTPGERLPSIRNLGSTLKVNPRTVVRAYEELGHLGLVVTRQGQGVFVLNGEAREPASQHARRAVLEDLTRRMLAEGTRMGADADEMLAIFEETCQAMQLPLSKSETTPRNASC